MLGDQCVDDLVESFALYDLRQLMQREVNAVIGDAALRVIVSPDAFRTVARTDLAAPFGRACGIALCLFDVIELRA